MKETSTTGGRGTRYFDPEDDTVMVMFEVGDPEAKDPVHQGPYAKWSVKGLGKKGQVREPLDGNPNPDAVFDGTVPKQITDWGNESLLEVVEEAVEEGGE